MVNSEDLIKRAFQTVVQQKQGTTASMLLSVPAMGEAQHRAECQDLTEYMYLFLQSHLTIKIIHHNYESL